MTLNGVFPIKKSLILYHTLLPTTMFMLWLIFSQLSNKWRKVDLSITIVFILVSVLNSIWHQTNIFPSHGLTLLCSLGIWLSLQTFKEMILLPTKVDITKRAVFWLAIFTLFFYAITFFAFTFFNFYSGITALQDLNFYASIVLYLGYFITLYFDINRSKYNYAN